MSNAMNLANLGMSMAPRVWIGCLACYNNGSLIGQWYDAEDAGEVAPEDVHGNPTAHEELWCFDHEGFPTGTEEMSPAGAAQWGEIYSEVGEVLWPAFLAWVANGGSVVDADGLPCPSNFEDVYQGEWESFMEYAQQLAEDVGMFAGWSEEAQRYFDWDAWTRDLAFDYTVVHAPAGDVFVFSQV